MGVSRFLKFGRRDWAKLRADTPLTLTAADLEHLRGLNEVVDLAEVEEVYLPLSRLLNLYVRAAQDLYGVTARFLGHPAPRVPYVIGVAGSVAVGKSTTSRILRALLSRWPNHPKVDLIATDGFLLPNKVLAERELMERKGFPESYDQRRLLQFVSDLKSGKAGITYPVYSHLIYDIVAGQEVSVESPDIVIIEGLNVLQSERRTHPGQPEQFVSDFFDFSIFIDAELPDIRRWYVERFLKLRGTAFRDPASYFHRYAELSDRAAAERAESIWREINEVNLLENILPTRERAHLILAKRADHSVQEIRLRKI